MNIIEKNGCLVIINELSHLATGRKSSAFLADIKGHREKIADAVRGKRVLVIGGAGSIGSAVVSEIMPFRPSSLCIVDRNENNLVEIVRDFQSRKGGIRIRDFQALPIDYGSPIMRRFIAEQTPFDIVMNFAALKHVRSEKDIFSLLQLLQTNVLNVARLLKWISSRGGSGRFFSVSTDKAANPVNLMGASKRLMEHVMFSGQVIEDDSLLISSARFANVAFSDGSLLFGFMKRWEKEQPLAAPQGARRFFVSLEEAAHICLMAAFCAPHKHIIVPKLDPAKDTRELETIARLFIQSMGLEPKIYFEEAASRENVSRDIGENRYPLLITPLDTSGEKIEEEFVGEGEIAKNIGFFNILGIPYFPAPPGSVGALIEWIEGYASSAHGSITKADVVEAVKTVVKEFRHIETGKSLDLRM